MYGVFDAYEISRKVFGYNLTKVIYSSFDNYTRYIEFIYRL